MSSVIMWHARVLSKRGELLEMHTEILCFLFIQKVL